MMLLGQKQAFLKMASDGLYFFGNENVILNGALLQPCALSPHYNTHACYYNGPLNRITPYPC